MANWEKFHETRRKNRAVLYRKNSRTGHLKVRCNMFAALSHGETGFMEPNLMKLVASCDIALNYTYIWRSALKDARNMDFYTSGEFPFSLALTLFYLKWTDCINNEIRHLGNTQVPFILVEQYLYGRYFPCISPLVFVCISYNYTCTFVYMYLF